MPIGYRPGYYSFCESSKLFWCLTNALQPFSFPYELNSLRLTGFTLVHIVTFLFASFQSLKPYNILLHVNFREGKA